MKKILFIEPPPTLDWTADSKVSKAGRRHPCLNETGEQVYSYQNLSCAAVLRESGFDPAYFHCPTQRLDVAATKAKMAEIAPFALVIMKEHINADAADELARFARSKRIVAIYAGPFVTALYDEEMKKGSVDFVLRKEWDYGVRDLVRALENGADLKSVKGLVWRGPDGAVVVNEDAAPIIDMDALPIPAYDLVDLGKFYESVFVKFPAATMITSRGCPFHCIYCSYPQTIYGHTYRAMSPQRVVREIECLVREHGVKEIRIDDDTFNVNAQRVIDICRLIIGKKIKVAFSVQARAQLMTEEMAKWLRKAGCRMVLYGVETGNERVMKEIRKKTTLDEIRQGVRIAKKYGIDVLNCVMLGFYWDTKESVEDTMNFAFELNAEFTQVSVPTPLPGTDYYDLLIKNKCMLTPDWTQYDSVHHAAVELPHLSAGDLNHYLDTFYRRYYRRPRYILMMLLRMFRSWGNFSQSVRKFGVLFTK